MKYAFFLMFFIIGSNTLYSIEEFLLQFKRPFTMITIGDDIDTILKATAIYPDSVFILTGVESNFPFLPNLIVLAKKLNLEDLKILGQCEDFDVVYFANFDQHTQEVLQEIENLGQYIAVATKEGSYPLKTKKQYLLRKTWVRDLHTEKSHRIYSTFEEKKLFKCNKALSGNTIISDWKPGINLITFKMLGGIYPTKKTIIDQLNALRAVPHNDWVINNMILQGNKVLLIDFDDPRRGLKTFCSDKLFEDHVRIIEMDDSQKIKRLLINGLK